MTATTMTAPPPAPVARPGFWRHYGSLWAAAPKAFAAIIALGAIASATVGLLWGLFAAGVGLAVLVIGVFLVVAALYVARWIGFVDLAIIEWSGRPRIPRPAFRQREGFFPWLGSVFGNPHYWLHLVYCLLPQVILAAVTFGVAVAAVGTAVGGILWVPWMWAATPGPGAGFVGWGDWGLGGPWGIGAPWGIGGGILRTVVGLAVAFCLPWILRGLTWAHWGLARLMLGAFRAEALEQELVGAQASRAAAVAAEDTAIRRIERDIHDGPQQRLIRLQMDLASADRRMAESPEEARGLIASATEQAREALDELRALSRGFAPPILLDRGLIAALESAATRSAVPVEITGAVPAGLLPPEIERNAYFIASEALTNAVKHARASRIGIAVAADAIGRAVTITVSDDGAGGAVVVPDHGLAGLQDRVHGLGGTLAIDSPAGGPTVLTARLPW